MTYNINYIVLNYIVKHGNLKLMQPRQIFCFFSRGNFKTKHFRFIYNNSEIEIVTEVKYLGLLLSKTGSFIHAKKDLINRASKSMFAVLKKSRLFNLSIDCQ